MSLPKGFKAAAVACGLKASGSPDLGLLVSETHANACTGRQGLSDAKAMGIHAAAAVGVRRDQMLVASTGVIGELMNMDAVRSGIDAAAPALDPRSADAFAASIMTTDTRPKTAVAPVGGATMLGFAKGAGMMAPEMATMLTFIVTDAAVDRGVIANALRAAVAESFNALSLDGCMSTNDTVLVLANGGAGEDPITHDDPRVPAFTDALTQVCGSLARQIADDGEGMTKLVTIRVQGCAGTREARVAARTIADSVLLRCALNGADPYWGRVLAALGTAPIPLDPYQVDVWMGGEKLCEGGTFGPGDRDKARAALRDREIEILVDLHRGSDSATMLTNDLSVEYVRFNTEYTT